MRRYGVGVLAALALLSGCGTDEQKSADPVAVQAPCLVTATGAGLCGPDAIAWCEAISEEVGEMGTSNTWRTVGSGADVACAGVGWDGGGPK